MQKITSKIDELLTGHFQTHPFWIQFAADNPAGFCAVRDSVLAPGKRLRPLLFSAACRDAACDPFPDFAPALLALELVHGFILIHDDILDRSAMRRGALTLAARMEEQFTEKPADGFRGSDFALVAGDLLYIQSIEALMSLHVSDTCKTEALRLFSQAALDTGRGALLEMRVAQASPGELNLEQIENLYALKTGSYSFSLPLQLAALLCPELDGKEFAEIGKQAGIAFQLQNDLAELVQWAGGGPFPDDIRDRRRTWPLVYAGSEAGLRETETRDAVRKAAETRRQTALALAADLPNVRTVLDRVLTSKS